MAFDPWTPLEESGKLPKPPGRAETLEHIRQNPYVKPEVRRRRQEEAERAAKKAARQAKPEIPIGSGLRWKRPVGIGRRPGKRL